MGSRKFLIRLRALPGAASVERRLAALLKAALRAWGFRCVGYREEYRETKPKVCILCGVPMIENAFIPLHWWCERCGMIAQERGPHTQTRRRTHGQA